MGHISFTLKSRKSLFQLIPNTKSVHRVNFRYHRSHQRQKLSDQACVANFHFLTVINLCSVDQLVIGKSRQVGLCLLPGSLGNVLTPSPQAKPLTKVERYAAVHDNL